MQESSDSSPERSLAQNPVNPVNPVFTNKTLIALLAPLMIEHVLNVTIGMADTVMVAGLSEAAISAVSLVDQFNQLVMQVFTSLATGGAVVAAQYIGRRDRAGGCDAARQLIQITLFIGIIVMAAVLAGSGPVLRLIYGQLDPDVMAGAVSYLSVTTISLPCFALYAACAALFRAMGNSKISLYTSLLMNLVNISGNYISIYHWGWGVSGAAAATSMSRLCGAAALMWMIVHPHQELFVDQVWRVRLNFANIRRILKVGVPTGLENGVFQIGKLTVMRLVASLGTTAVAANAIGNTFAGIACMPGSAASIALITVVGQCVGARAYDEVKRDTRKLMMFAIGVMAAIGVAMLLLLQPALSWFGELSADTRMLATSILIPYYIITWLVWPFSFTLPNALRGAGDTKVTMYVSVASMIAFRVVFSYLLAGYLKIGLHGVWLGMYIDWVVRSVFFMIRFLSGKWKAIKVI